MRRRGSLLAVGDQQRLQWLLVRGKCQREIVAKGHALEERPKTIEIRLGEGLGLVIVAAGAGHGQPEKRRAGGLHKIVHQSIAHPILFPKELGAIVPRPHSQVARGQECVLLRCIFRLSRHQLVARKLLGNKRCVGLVSVEAAHHIVPVAPGKRSELIPVEAVAVGVAHHVQPEPRLMLAVAVTRQKPLRKSRRGRKTRDLALGWWEPREIEAQPPRQRPFIGKRRVCRPE